MAHYHFNGTCEQSARNFHGAIARNYDSSDKLDARLSCGKRTLPYRYAVSGCMIPLAYDEDGEIETRRGIVITQGFANANDVRFHANHDMTTCESKRTYGTTTRDIFKGDLADAIKVINSNCGQKKKAAALAMLDHAIRNELKPRFNRKLFRSYESGKLSAMDLLRSAGLIAGRI